MVRHRRTGSTADNRVMPRRLGRSAPHMKGFTLLEILLVIGILAVLVLFGLHVLQGQEKRSRVERAGQELQSVMQAAIYYHSTNHAWPDENSKPTCSSERSDGNFTHYYLPKGADGEEERSSFGTYYCWQEHATDGDDYENSALFDVYLPVNGKDACQTAHKIAGTVPNAHAVSALNADSSGQCGDETAYFVRAQVVPSAQSIHEKSGQRFRGIGQCVPETAPNCSDDASFAESSTACCHVSGSNPTQYKIHFPACDAGQTQKIVYLPAFITYMYNAKTYDVQKVFDRGYIHGTKDPSVDPTSIRSSIPASSCNQYSNELVCSITLGIGMHTQNSGVVDLTNPVSPYASGSVGAVYVASCMDER